MSDRAWVGVDFIIVAAFGRLVAEEVDVGIGETSTTTIGPVLFVLDVAEAVRLVPAVWEDVKGDLAADGEAGRVC